MQEQPATSVIGAGAWGTALANLLAQKAVPTVLWAREPEVAADVMAHHENRTFLGGFALDHRLGATTDLAEAIDAAVVVVNAVPTQHMRATLAPVADRLGRAELIVSVSKGIEMETLRTPNEILAEIGVSADRVVALSGPSFAAEVAAGQPSAVTVAGTDPERVRQARDLFSTANFRVYSSGDIVAVELGGALKNVMAIAVGIADGLGFGRNTRAALITRGLAEITRLGVALGGDAHTFAGLSGMGDLVLTCTGDLSRNRSVGLALGSGAKLEQILADMNEVTEGVHTSRAALELGERAGVEMPITREVCAVLHEGKDPRQAVIDLSARDLRDEVWF